VVLNPKQNNTLADVAKETQLFPHREVIAADQISEHQEGWN